MEAATYHRIRSAISAAKATGAVTVLASSTELTLPAAAEYAKNYMAMERVHGIGVTVAEVCRARLEIRPPGMPRHFIR
jgi:pantoate kinase